MIGISHGSSANASLLGNFEIVATTVIALFIFKETVSKRLWLAESIQLSYGSLFVLLATICWGFENNCTRSISSKDTYEIVILKGFFSGLGSLVIAFIRREDFPEMGDARKPKNERKSITEERGWTLDLLM